ncbi:uncharacterized protein K02A2.6-like [Ornithodoros turicata]|uniref:uncharacterized protein K02A2.6-like n=1 Tax=Ornithodoros turicata TaxID=34597 RepID=UPI003139B6E7
METLLPTFPPFNPHSDVSSLSPRWLKWIARFENFLLAANITDPARKRAMLLHYAGEEVYDVFQTLPNTETDFDTAVTRLKEHFAPKKNAVFERHIFRQARQDAGETLGQFQVRLRRLAATCEFTDIEKELVSQIIEGTTSHKLRRAALRETDITLEKLLALGSSIETAELQASSIESPSQTSTVQKVDAKKHERRRTRRKKTGSEQRQTAKCSGCGGSWPHKNGKTSCPAWEAVCHNCGKRNHFAKWCRSAREPKEKIRSLTTSSATTEALRPASSDESVFHVHGTASKLPTVTITLNEKPLEFFLDTGAGVNVVGERTWRTHLRVPLEATTTRLVPYGVQQEIPVMGKFTAMFSAKLSSTRAEVYVVQGPQPSLLSYKTARELMLIDIVQAVAEHTSVDARKEFPKLFGGLGRLKQFQVKLEISSDVSPVARQHRRIPFRVRKALEAELARLEALDIIEHVTGPTPWVSPIVVVPKPHTDGAVRMCIDMREANKAIARVRHVMPTIEDIISILNGAAFFSKLDLNEGYHQLELDESSRTITTFSTHCGLRRYKRLLFGVNAAAEIFQDAIRQILPDENGIINVSDDILISGRTMEEHDRRLRLVLMSLQDAGLTLNGKKCVIGARTLKFYGHVFSADGISVDPEKVEAVTKMAPPKDATEVRSLLGMVNYCSRFIPRLAEIAEPLRALTRSELEFRWTEDHQKALDKIKLLMSQSQTLAYFDVNKETCIITDAGPDGIAGILIQEAKDGKRPSILAYYSRALSPTEKKYPQIDKEMLAIVSTVERFRVYLAGGKFLVKTDHLPLVSILRNSSAKLSARLERLSLRLQHYVFDIQHIPGKENPADYLSRHPIVASGEDSPTQETSAVEEYVRFVLNSATPKALTAQDIENVYKGDPQMDLLITALRTTDQSSLDSLWRHELLKPFYQIREELTVTESNLVLRGTRLVIPGKAQMDIVRLAHRGHQGIVKTKQLVREKVWFPGIDKKVESAVRNCEACQRTVEEKMTSPLMMTPLPGGPWQSLAADFAGPLPGNKYLLVVVDEYSRFPVVSTLSSLTGKTVIAKLTEIFAVHGIPYVLKTDNGPPFFGKEFAEFAAHNGIRHHRTTPLWPQANGEVERFIKNVKKTVKAAGIQGRSWKEELHEYLLNYRATPHTTTGITPSELLFGRKIRTKLPQLPETRHYGKLETSDRQKKQDMKVYADEKRHARPHQLQRGDCVLLKRPSTLSHEAPYEQQPYTVTRVQGTAVTATRGDRRVVRNASYFKWIPHNQSRISDDWDVVDDCARPRSDEAPSVDRTEARESPSEQTPPDDASNAPRAVPVVNEATQPATRRYPERSTRAKPPKRYGDFVLN